MLLCLRCGKPMGLRELHPLYESGGITFRLEAAAVAYACDDCRTLSPEPPPAPEPAPVVQAAGAPSSTG